MVSLLVKDKRRKGVPFLTLFELKNILFFLIALTLPGEPFKAMLLHGFLFIYKGFEPTTCDNIGNVVFSKKTVNSRESAVIYFFYN